MWRTLSEVPAAADKQGFLVRNTSNMGAIQLLYKTNSLKRTTVRKRVSVNTRDGNSPILVGPKIGSAGVRSLELDYAG